MFTCFYWKLWMALMRMYDLSKPHLYLANCEMLGGVLFQKLFFFHVSNFFRLYTVNYKRSRPLNFTSYLNSWILGTMISVMQVSHYIESMVYPNLYEIPVKHQFSSELNYLRRNKIQSPCSFTVDCTSI